MAKSMLKDTWAPEILLICLSSTSFITIITLLSHFDGKPLLTFHRLSLNTIVSILSTVFKTSLLFVVSSCLGQWKYVALFYSRQKNRLIDFEILDDASRGPKGSVSLLWHTRFTSLAALGAVITLLALFIDPFLQQVIALEDRQSQVLEQLTSIPRAVRYSKGNEYNIDFSQMGGPPLPINFTVASGVTSDFSMQAAILSGLSNLTGVMSQSVEARCPSASCTWGPHDTLAVCIECSDITNQIRTNTFDITDVDQVLAYTIDALTILQAISDTLGWISSFLGLGNLLIGTITAAQLPNGLYIQTNDSDSANQSSLPFTDSNSWDRIVEMVTYGTSLKNETVSFQQNDLLLWSTTVLKRDQHSTLEFTAEECGLSYCMQRITSNYTNGTLQESSERVSPSRKSNALAAFNGTQFDQLPDLEFDGGFTVAQKSMVGIVAYMEQVFALNKTTTTHGATGYYTGSKSNRTDAALYHPDSMQHIFGSTNLSTTFQMLAQSMTNNFRMNDETGTLVYGTSSVTVYKVRWPWVILPAIGLVGGMLFLGILILCTGKSGAPLWKSSALPVLKCGTEIGEVLRESQRLSEMRMVAKEANMDLLDMRIVRLASSNKLYEEVES